MRQLRLELIRENCFDLLLKELGRMISASVKQESMKGVVLDMSDGRKFVLEAISTFLENENNHPPICQCTSEMMCGKHNDHFFFVYLYSVIGTGIDLKFSGQNKSFEMKLVADEIKKILMDKNDMKNHVLLYNLDELAEYEIRKYSEKTSEV